LVIANFLVFDLFKFLESFSVLLLVDVVHDQFFVAVGLFRKFDAFFNLAVRLENLEDRVSIQIGLVLSNELSEAHLEDSQLFLVKLQCIGFRLELLLCRWLGLFVLVPWVDNFDIVVGIFSSDGSYLRQHQFSDPSADDHALGLKLRAVLILPLDFLQDELEVADQPDRLVVLQVLEADCLETEAALNVEVCCFVILSTVEELVSIDGRDEFLLLGSTAVEIRGLDLLFFQVVLPCVLVLALECGCLNPILGTVGQELVGSQVE
jgi:hypothetical protein